MCEADALPLTPQQTAIVVTMAKSWQTKLALYKMLILPVFFYGAEIWVLANKVEQALDVVERKN